MKIRLGVRRQPPAASTPASWRRARDRARAGLPADAVETRTDASLLHALLAELTGGDGQLWLPMLTPLYERHRGNLRDVFLALYDLAAVGLPATRIDGSHPSG